MHQFYGMGKLVVITGISDNINTKISCYKNNNNYFIMKIKKNISNMMMIKRIYTCLLFIEV